MGAFGSCLGVGRPMKPNDATLIGSNLVNVDGNPFGPGGPTNGRHMMRPYLANGMPNGKSPMQKLMRQSSSMSTSNGQVSSQLLPPYKDKNNNHNSPLGIPKLVDIDDNPSSPFDKQTKQGSHLVCNRNKFIDNVVDDINDNNPENENAIKKLIATCETAPHRIITLIARYDHDATNSKDDLCFRKGEQFETIPSLMDGQWWVARSKLTGKIGYIHSTFVARLNSFTAEPWFSDQISRSDAESLLINPENMDGTFIIRVSEQKLSHTSSGHNYSLSVKHQDSVKHYKIKHESRNFYISPKKVFPTLQGLVAHYSEQMDGLCINLRAPCPLRMDKPSIPGTAYLARDRWEIGQSEVEILHELGRGQFGQVFEGVFKKSGDRVAIKTLRKDSMPLKDFLAEAQIMKKMSHPNLVKLIAVSTKEEPVYIITELMSKGALINYLQTGEGKNLPMKDYIKMAEQIADGMSYLERQKYVHRDLAARNILVGDNNVCKIADFGLARIIQETEYEAHPGAKFPIKWTAPEAASYSKFTIKSDVWSFGIVLYEIITKGGTPYPDMLNAEVVTKIEHGYRMPQPPGCEDKYYTIMTKCWHKDPQLRPTFEALHSDLQLYFYSDEQYREASQFRESYCR